MAGEITVVCLLLFLLLLLLLPLFLASPLPCSLSPPFSLPSFPFVPLSMFAPRPFFSRRDAVSLVLPVLRRAIFLPCVYTHYHEIASSPMRVCVAYESVSRKVAPCVCNQ